jgi:hypothetical protein
MRRHLRSRVLRTAVLLGGFAPWSLLAQQAAQVAVSELNLPEAPGLGSLQGDSGQASPETQPAGRIFGVVEDSDGAVVPGARIAVVQGTSFEKVVVSGSGGEFDVTGLSAGGYRVIVTAVGMGEYVSPEVRLAAGASRELLHIVLPIVIAHVDVRVEANETEIATEQINAQEQQRVLGILPNFYTSYVWNAAPLTPRLKFQLAMKSVLDPVSILGAGALAGVQQAANSFPGYGQEVMGYSKRVAAAYADDAIARMIGSALLPTFLHQDPRYFYRGSGSKLSRAGYALSAAFICKGDNGRWQPNYSRIGGSFAAGGIANLYHPAGDRGASLTVRNALIDTAGNAGTNLLREFLLRGLTPKVPSYANGKP